MGALPPVPVSGAGPGPWGDLPPMPPVVRSSASHAEGFFKSLRALRFFRGGPRLDAFLRAVGFAIRRWLGGGLDMLTAMLRLC